MSEAEKLIDRYIEGQQDETGKVPPQFLSKKKKNGKNDKKKKPPFGKDDDGDEA